MKKIAFLLFLLFTLSSISYASFPVTENGKTVQYSVVDNSDLTFEAPIRRGGPGMGIAALCCGILGFFFLPFLLGPLAIVFGALGLKNEGRGMAITGLILGIIQVLLVLIVLVIVGAALSAGLY
ncbi:MAG: DUF4190 domain-containing protein [Bacteroidota bacterium]|nr:DUF4190 domain-containing protein [Bacteroidota bacterium]